MNPAVAIIKKFGGMSALARALGHKHVTTVQGWRDSGRIPAKQQPLVLAAADRVGVRIRPADLVVMPPPRKRRSAA
jgi:hypothetical protein